MTILDFGLHGVVMGALVAKPYLQKMRKIMPDLRCDTCGTELRHLGNYDYHCPVCLPLHNVPREEPKCPACERGIPTNVTKMFSIDPRTIKHAAREKYGEDLEEVSGPYFVDHETVRVGILLKDGQSFGANFFYKEGVFK